MIVAGIDPGKTGAMAILYPDQSVQFFDVPRVKLKGKDKPAWSLWGNQWSTALKLAEPTLVVIEEVAARPGQGVTSMFAFGRTLGFAHAIVQSSTFCEVLFVPPSVWKAKMGLLKSDKSASREKCRTLLPNAASRICRVKDDGRAEAALMAYYGRRLL